MEIVRWIVAASFAFLAVMGIRLWLRSPQPAAGWSAAMLGSLGIALVVNRMLPEAPQGLIAAVAIASSALVVAFPYLLFRFAESFHPVGRPWRTLATAVGLATVAATVTALSTAPQNGDDATWYRLFVLAVLAVWTALTAWAVWRLWSAGRHQPDLTRRRMRTMALAAGLLNAALLLTGLGDTEAFTAAGQVTAFASATTFLLAFSPPQFLRAMWRQPDERALWQAEGDLVAANSREAVIAAVLPHVARLLGGAGALFVDYGGQETAIGLDAPTRRHVQRALQTAPDQQTGAVLAAGVVTLVLRQGRLGVATSPYTPFFGHDELELIERLGALLDLALSRVEASLTTTVLAAFEQGLIPHIIAPDGLVVESRYRAGLARLQLGGTSWMWWPSPTTPGPSSSAT